MQGPAALTRMGAQQHRLHVHRQAGRAEMLCEWVLDRLRICRIKGRGAQPSAAEIHSVPRASPPLGGSRLRPEFLHLSRLPDILVDPVPEPGDRETRVRQEGSHDAEQSALLTLKPRVVPGSLTRKWRLAGSVGVVRSKDA